MNSIFTGCMLIIIIVSLHACVVDQPDLSRYTGGGIENLEEARNIDVVYTDSSFKVLELKAPLSRRIYSKYAVTEEFPEGIDVTFYDKNGIARSWLTAEHAVRDQANRIVRVEDNVVMKNDRGERLDGPELIWNEKTKEIYTDRFVRITRADGSIVYSYGFKSNDRFTRYELNAISGEIPMDEFAKAPADSTSAQ